MLGDVGAAFYELFTCSPSKALKTWQPQNSAKLYSSETVRLRVLLWLLHHPQEAVCLCVLFLAVPDLNFFMSLIARNSV